VAGWWKRLLKGAALNTALAWFYSLPFWTQVMAAITGVLVAAGAHVYEAPWFLQLLFALGAAALVLELAHLIGAVRHAAYPAPALPEPGAAPPSEEERSAQPTPDGILPSLEDAIRQAWAKQQNQAHANLRETVLSRSAVLLQSPDAVARHAKQLADAATSSAGEAARHPIHHLARSYVEGCDWLDGIWEVSGSWDLGSPARVCRQGLRNWYAALREHALAVSEPLTSAIEMAPPLTKDGMETPRLVVTGLPIDREQIDLDGAIRGILKILGDWIVTRPVGA
jgi:hypothetical protein